MRNCIISISVLAFCVSSALANSAPVVSNATAVQRMDDSKLVDVYYDLADADGDSCTVWAVISDDGGATWTVPAMSFTGDCGADVSPGAGKHIIWDAGRDMPGKVGTYKARVCADDGKGNSDMVVVPAGWFKYQNHATADTYCGTFLIDRCEVTNAQYVEFLNKPGNDDHYYSSMQIVRIGTAPPYTYSLVVGKEQCPVQYASALGAEAFAVWKSETYGGTYRLPTEQEWEKAAGWDPTLQKLWTYGFQQDVINSAWCNYNNAYDGPLAVGSFNGTGGKNLAKSYYGCFDMTGNLWEYTSSMYDSVNRVLRGGDWDSDATRCAVTCRIFGSPSSPDGYSGFRLVLE
jgi:hypothetical protein